VAGVLVVKKAAEDAVRGRGPVVDAGMIRKLRSQPSTGDAIRLGSDDGSFLAWGVGTGDTRFPVRLVSWDQATVVDPAFFAGVAVRAARKRLALAFTRETNAYRVVFAEADGFPCLVADRYDAWLVMALDGRTMARYASATAAALMAELGLRGALVREPNGSRCFGEEPPPESLEIREGLCRFLVDVREGQKTGWFCDQRENRRRVAGYAVGAEVLDVFAYTGGFAVTCLAAGARSVTLVDSSASALELAERNLRLNAVADRAEIVKADAFWALKDMATSGRLFDLVIADPPKLLPPQAGRTEATRAYRRLQGFAMKLVRPGGLLATFSCSGAMDRASFDQVVAEAAGAREARVLERLGQPPDHPVLLSFRKSEYLKGLILQLG